MKRNILLTIALAGVSLFASAQSSFPAPGGNAPGGGPGGPGFGNSAPAPGGMAPSNVGWGSPWGPGWAGGLPPVSSAAWQNNGVITVMACGYDAQGVWRVLPLRVAYSYNGIQYNVQVLNAWDPWTNMWNNGVDVPAVNTSYYLRGNTYNFYVVLSTGTYYFNL